MKHIVKTSILALICSLSAFDASAKKPAPTVEELQLSLSQASTPTDSLRIVNDLFDVAPRANNEEYATLGYNLAMRANDYTAALDMLRNLANIHHSDEMKLDADYDKLKRIPSSDDRDETECFIRLIQNYARAQNSDPSSEDQYIQALVNKLNTDNAISVYDKIVLLHDLCIHIANVSYGQLLEQYLNELEQTIETLRPEAYPIRNNFYVQASLAYNQSNVNPERALIYDRKLLDNIDKLEEGKLGYNHPYRNYNPNRYVIIARMLNNYETMTEEQVDDLYNQAMELVKIDPTAAKTNASSQRPQIFYAAKHGDTATALRLLKETINSNTNAPQRLKLLKIMTWAAEAEGDKEALLYASTEYNQELENLLEKRAHETWRELQIVYELSKIREAYQNEEIKWHQRMIWFVSIAAGVLLLLLVGVIILWRRARSYGRRLIEANEALKTERDNLKSTTEKLADANEQARLADKVKTAFIKNISAEIKYPVNSILEYTPLLVDCAEPNIKPYMRQYADLVELNAQTLATIIDDRLVLAQVDNNDIHPHHSSESIERLCTTAIKTIQASVPKSVTVGINPEAADFQFSTDKLRFMQIMLQLLSNAAKFTPKGSVTIDYHLDDKEKKAYISVTDTGRGINPSKADVIFERFVKLDPSVQGAGIGLPLARALAKMLGGDVVLDTCYRDGARFILTLPL